MHSILCAKVVNVTLSEGVLVSMQNYVNCDAANGAENIMQNTDAIEIISQRNFAGDQLMSQVVILLFQSKIHQRQPLVFTLSHQDDSEVTMIIIIIIILLDWQTHHYSY